MLQEHFDLPRKVPSKIINQNVAKSELVGFLDFQETKKTNFESWIVGFPRNQLFFSESWILGLTKKPTLKLDSWISAKNQQTNMKVGLLD